MEEVQIADQNAGTWQPSPILSHIRSVNCMTVSSTSSNLAQNAGDMNAVASSLISRSQAANENTASAADNVRMAAEVAASSPVLPQKSASGRRSLPSQGRL